jgi:hypothetical protein
MEGTPGASRKRAGCSPAATLLHATDLRHVPFILTYGLFSGIGRAPLASGCERGRAYTREIVARQGRKGWEIVILTFDVPAAWATEAEEPAGVGFNLVPPLPPPTLPPRLLEGLATILPQGPGIVRAFTEWHREGRLVGLPPVYLDRLATLKVNERLVTARLLPASTVSVLDRILRHEANDHLGDY